MKKGFTLLELIVVIIIIGILATLGFTQYSRIVERSRGAEARAILGSIRTTAGAFFLERGNLTGFDDTAAGIGTATDQIPGPAAIDCRNSHYFFYAVSVAGTTLTSTATRCLGAAGKPPGYAGAIAPTLTLDSTFPGATADTWTGPY